MRVQFQEEKMHTKDAIQFALTVSNGAVLSAIDEMSGVATTFPTPNGGCHPLWVLGHLTLVEGMIPAVLFGDENPAVEWQQYFGENSEPVSDPGAYPPLTEVREKYLQLREQNLKLLESLSEEDLDSLLRRRPKDGSGSSPRTGRASSYWPCTRRCIAATSPMRDARLGVRRRRASPT
jgi:hypothetical protein